MQDQDIEVTVRCGGKYHRIVLRANGRLVFCDHTPAEIRSEFALAALGGQACRCAEVLAAWRQRNTTKLPPALRNASARMMLLREHRLNLALVRDPLTIPFRARARTYVQNRAYEALCLTTYRRAQSRWAGGKHQFGVEFASTPSVKGFADRVWSANGRWSGNNSCIVAYIAQGWLSRVWKRGVAVVDGCFVLEVCEDRGDEMVVLAGKQGRGFDVYPCRALVRRGADGQYHIARWLKEE